MNSIFKKRTCDLLRISEKEFDRIFAEKPFRAIRINPLKSDFSTVQKGFDFVLEPAPFHKNSLSYSTTKTKYVNFSLEISEYKIYN